MVPYKLKMMHVEDDILNFSPIIHNRNNYPRKYNNCVDDSSMVILYDENLGDTIVAGNTYLSINNIPESRYSFLPYPRISSKKYMICSEKKKKIPPQILPLTKGRQGSSLLQFWRLLVIDE